MDAGLDFFSEIKEVHIPQDIIDQYKFFFDNLEENNFTIPSWMLQSFWENTRDPIFRISFLKRLFDFSYNLFQENKKPNEIPYRYLNSLLCIYLLIIHFNFEKNSKPLSTVLGDSPNIDNITVIGNNLIHQEYLQRKIHSWISLSTFRLNSLFPELFNSIQLQFKQLDKPNTPFFARAFNLLLVQQNIPIVDYSVPFFTLYSLFSFLKRYPTEIDNFIDALKNVISPLLDLDQLKLLLHTIYLALIFFPGTIPTEISEELYPILSKSGYVSLTCSNIGLNIQKEKHYPGYTYYLLLNNLSNSNLAFSGNIPTFLSSSSRFIDSFLYNCYPENSIVSLPMSIISFTKFYLKAKFQCEKEFSIQELLQISSKLEFSSENSSELAKTYNIPYIKEHKKSKTSGEDVKSKKDANSDSKRKPQKKVDLNSVEFPSHPVTKLQIQKLSLDFEINSATPVPYEGLHIYTTTASFIFQKAIFNPIKNYIKTTNNSQLHEYHILLIGDDFLIGNALLSYVSAQSQMKNCLSQISLIFHIVPADDTKSNQIADFISSFDPIYRQFVRHLFPIMCSISPTINEKSEVSDVPLILDLGPDEGNFDKNRFDNTIWFGNPNPFNMFNFGLQHYMQFAQNSVDVMVWKCVIHYKDNTKKVVIVPFVSSIQIGPAFSLTSQSLIVQSSQNDQNNQNNQLKSVIISQSSSGIQMNLSQDIANVANEVEQENNDENAFIASSLEHTEDSIGMQGILLAKNESKIKTRSNYQHFNIDKFETVLPKNNDENNEEDILNQPNGSNQSIDTENEDIQKKVKTRRRTDTSCPVKTIPDSLASSVPIPNNPKRESMNGIPKRRNTRNNSFSSQGPQKPSEEINMDDLENRYVMVIKDCSQQTRVETTKFNSIAFWNANADLHVNPSDGWLMMEYTSSNKIRFNNESSRIDNADKLYQELITEASLESINIESSFLATIDQSVYGPLKKISISPLLCDYEKENRMRMKFASFSPFI